MAWFLKMAGSLPQVPRCMAADGWRYGQGQGLHGSLVRSILEQTTTREASSVSGALQVVSGALQVRHGMAGCSRLTLFAPCSPFGGAGTALLAGLGGHASPAVTVAHRLLPCPP